MDHQIKLFNEIVNRTENLLPADGIVNYYGKIFSDEMAAAYFDGLLNTIEWKHDELLMYGKKIITRRKMAWYGEGAFSYTYSNVERKALPWTDELFRIKCFIEQTCSEKFNACLLNLYHNGGEGMGWHSDDEKELLHEGAIASVSFGAERKFEFRHKQTKSKISIMLENGSLLVMKGKTQQYWHHQLPHARKILTPRINLTFRTIVS